VSLLFFAGGIGEPARLESRFQASPGSRGSPVREFIGERHLEGAGGPVCARGFGSREPWRSRLSSPSKDAAARWARFC